MAVVPAILNYSDIADYDGGDWLVSLPDKDHITLLNLISVIAANPDRYFQDWEGNEFDIYDLCDSIIGRLLEPVSIAYPKRLLQLAYQYSGFGGVGTPSFTHDASQNLGFYLTRSGFANGDNWVFKFVLDAGTYIVYAQTIKNTVMGMCNLTANNQNLGTIDFYNSPQINNFIASWSGLTVASPGEITLQFTVNGKNALSTAFALVLTAVWIEKT